MKSLVKKRVLGVRLSDQEAADLKRAATQESHRRGERVDESTLLRELGMPLVRELLGRVAA